MRQVRLPGGYSLEKPIRRRNVGRPSGDVRLTPINHFQNQGTKEFASYLGAGDPAADHEVELELESKTSLAEVDAQPRDVRQVGAWILRVNHNGGSPLVALCEKGKQFPFCLLGKIAKDASRAHVSSIHNELARCANALLDGFCGGDAKCAKGDDDATKKGRAGHESEVLKTSEARRAEMTRDNFSLPRVIKSKLFPLFGV